MPFGPQNEYDAPAVGMTTERAAAILVLGALALLILLNRGFRGVNFFGASARIG
jgi:hypothetical protein